MRLAVTKTDSAVSVFSCLFLAYRSCKKVYEANSDNLKSGTYHLQSGDHYCEMKHLGECDKGGWTLAISINGSRVWKTI